MKGIHLASCIEKRPACQCNTCANDNAYTGSCCCMDKKKPCEELCPDYEPETEDKTEAAP